MSPSLETTRPKALSLLHEAIEEMRAYRQEQNRVEHLDVARSKIQASLAEDPGYLRAVYYEAIVDDLQGRAPDALPKYQRVLDSAQGHREFLLELHYNLGVALYHHYHHAWLERAIEEFDQVIAGASDESLRTLALAGRAQARAMHMIPSTPAEVNLEELQRYSGLARQDIEAVPGRRWFGLDLLTRRTSQDAMRAARWAASNASGMRKMYLADFFDQLDSSAREEGSALDLLQSARKDLEAAEALRAKDWANWCDLGSVHMRLGRAFQLAGNAGERERHFGEAERHLREVVEKLRPGYGFALYELGRLYRLWGKFEESRAYLERAQAIPEDLRDVGDKRMQLELGRTDKQLSEYP